MARSVLCAALPCKLDRAPARELPEAARGYASAATHVVMATPLNGCTVIRNLAMIACHADAIIESNPLATTRDATSRKSH